MSSDMIPSVDKNNQPTSMGVNQNTMNETKKMFLFGLLGCVVVIFVISLSFGVYRVYAQVATDRFALAVARILRLPVLKVNGESALYTDYVADIQAISTMRAYDQAHNGPGASLTDEQMSDQVLIRLANNLLVAQGGKEFGLTITDKDVEDVKQQALLSKFPSPAEAEKALKDRYGWTLALYQEKVIKPFVLQNKLAEKIQNDTAARDAIRAKAQGVLDQIKSGADFVALAKQYGEDGTAAKGGDLDWFGKGVMVPAFEAAAFALKKGELSPVLVESPYGYHIIRVDDRKIEKVKNDKGKMISQDSIRASHILFLFPSAEKYLGNLLKQATLHLYIRAHNPFKVLLQPVQK